MMYRDIKLATHNFKSVVIQDLKASVISEVKFVAITFVKDHFHQR